jgi:hypothetical protein
MAKLTNKEKCIIGLIEAGLSNSEILKDSKCMSLKVVLSDIKTARKIAKTLASSFSRGTKGRKKDFNERMYGYLASKLKRYPSLIEMNEKVGVTRAMIRETHGTITDLSEKAFRSYPEYFDKIYSNQTIDNDVTKARLKKAINKVVSKNGQLVVSSVGHGHHHKALKTLLKTYKKNNKNVEILLIPVVEDIHNIDPEIIEMHLRGDVHLIFDDVWAGKNLCVTYLTQSLTTTAPLAGLSKYNMKTVIVGGNHQIFQPAPVKRGVTPRAIMCPGSITMPAYRSSRFNSRPHAKSVKRAEENHFHGAWVVQFREDGTFVPRQLMFLNEDGSFPDDGIQYTQKGTKKAKAVAGIMGDLHSEEKSHYTFHEGLKYFKKIGIKKVYVHDGYNSTSHNPHDVRKTAYRAGIGLAGKTNMGHEIKVFADDLNAMTCSYGMDVKIVDSNHDDMFQRAFESGDLLNCPENGFLASLIYPISIIAYFQKRNHNIADLAKTKYGMDVKSFKEAFKHILDKPKALEFAVGLFGLKKKEKVEFLDLDDSRLEAGYECAIHGHQGANGAKGSVMSLANTFSKIITGHTHMPQQKNFNLCVGHNVDTGSDRPHYTKGGTTGWMSANGVIYEGGQFQHQFFINPPTNDEYLEMNMGKAA